MGTYFRGRGPGQVGRSAGGMMMADLVHPAGRRRVRELPDGIDNPAPGRFAIVIAAGCELLGARLAFVERFVAVALEHEVGGAADVDLGYHTPKNCRLRSGNA